MSDNRQRPRIHRTDDKHDKALRAYAKEHGIEPWQALEVAIEQIEGAEQTIKTCDTLRAAVTRAENVARAREIQRDDAIADCATEQRAHTATRAALESAREATRRADHAAAAAQEAYALASTERDDLRNQALRLTRELAEARAALETKGATAALPDDFEAKIAERAPGWKGTPAELRARVITLGFSRYDALATDAAKRAAERGR